VTEKEDFQWTVILLFYDAVSLDENYVIGKQVIYSYLAKRILILYSYQRQN